MTLKQVEDALQQKVDAAVPFLPRVVNTAATMGIPAAASGGPIRTAINDLAQKVAASGAPLPPRSRFARLFSRRAAR
jgi:hypothetical protein